MTTKAAAYCTSSQSEMEDDVEDDEDVEVEDELIHCERIPCSQPVPDKGVES